MPPEHQPTDIASDHEDIFVEQAEYLNQEAFAKWSEHHPDERAILSKLKGGGAKLLTGPRGSGKTTFSGKLAHYLKTKKSYYG